MKTHLLSFAHGVHFLRDNWLYHFKFLFKSYNNIDSNNEFVSKEQQVKEIDVSIVEISDDTVSVSIIANRINRVLIENDYHKVSGRQINDWLVSEGYLKIIEEGGKRFNIPTDTGTKLGIISEMRIICDESVRINMFEPTAQKYIVENTLKI